MLTSPSPSGTSQPHSLPRTPSAAHFASLQWTLLTCSPTFISASIGFAIAVQNHVSRIEVDRQIAAINIVEKLEQVVSGLLTGFQVQPLPFFANVIQQIAGAVDQAPVGRSLPVGRHEADMQPDGFHIEQLCEVGDFLHLLQRAARVASGTSPTVWAVTGIEA